jgi:hypothetical protein
LTLKKKGGGPLLATAISKMKNQEKIENRNTTPDVEIFKILKINEKEGC